MYARFRNSGERQMHQPRSTGSSIMAAVMALTITVVGVASYAEAQRSADPEARVRMLSNKLSLLERLVNQSPTAVRAQGEGEDVARDILEQAGEALAEAREVFAGENYDSAEISINRAFQLMAKASRTLGRPKTTPQAEQHKYVGLRERVVTFTDALERVYAEKGIDSTSEQADLQILRHGIEEAETLAQSDDYRDANRTLGSMAEMVEIALTRARHQQTLLHALTFESPEEEYTYEKGRNRSYEMLIGLLRNKQGVDATKLRFFSTVVEQNNSVRARADTLAAEGDLQGAIEHLERGTERLAKALRALGLSF
jgi:hypothetical protein